ncbi:hypothetical protein FA048_05345 [Pedobacter polaris]|uniref:Uncharacterized protein n=2 Tax=Pedobacter polaris TaxID=2571273 RepID=A0A4U1CVT2_9SPHI|nr:hypothetical protein FA048_05345 [Pedobacter polaris]
MVIAIPLVFKAKTHFSEANEKDSTEKSFNAQEKLATIIVFQFQAKNTVASNKSNLKFNSFKFNLPAAYSSLPKRPPKH